MTSWASATRGANTAAAPAAPSPLMTSRRRIVPSLFLLMVEPLVWPAPLDNRYPLFGIMPPAGFTLSLRGAALQEAEFTQLAAHGLGHVTGARRRAAEVR